MNAIEIKNLRKSLGNFSLKIDDLKVPEGFVTGFIGPNGSGKTTTIKLIMNRSIILIHFPNHTKKSSCFCLSVNKYYLCSLLLNRVKR